MMVVDLIEAFDRAVDSTRDMTKNALANGHAKSMEEYKELCGFLRGLESSQSILKDLAKKDLFDE